MYLVSFSGVRISSLQSKRGRGRQDTLEGFFQQPSQLSHYHEATPTELDTVCKDVASEVIHNANSSHTGLY